MRLLVILALVAVAVLFLTRKSAAAPSPGNGTAPPPPPLNELDQLAAATDVTSYNTPSAPTDTDGVNVTLPGGISFVFHGDPSEFPEIDDQNGIPFAIAGAR